MGTNKITHFSAVSALDAHLNGRVIRARTPTELNHALQLKTDVKRRLVAHPDDGLEVAARVALAELVSNAA